MQQFQLVEADRRKSSARDDELKAESNFAPDAGCKRSRTPTAVAEKSGANRSTG